MEYKRHHHGPLWWIVLIATVVLIAAFAFKLGATVEPTELTTYPLGWPVEYADGEEYLVPNAPLQHASCRGTVYRVAATVKDYLDVEGVEDFTAFVLDSDWGLIYVADLSTYCRARGFGLFGEDDGVDYTPPAVGERGRFVLTYLGLLNGEIPLFVYGANPEFVEAHRAELAARSNRGSIADVLASMVDTGETVEILP